MSHETWVNTCGRALPFWGVRAAIALLVCGYDGSPARASDVVHWEQIKASGPSPRAEFGLAYDSARSKTVLFGGSSDLSFTAVNRQTWEFDGTAWVLVTDTAGPSARCDNAMAFDSIRNEVVSFGGYNGSFFSDTWVWNGSVWTPRPVAGPTARADSFMAFDSGSGVMVLFGGLPPAGLIRNDTWFWNGTSWSVQAPATIPPRRWIQRMAYDSNRDMVVMFGGAAAGGLVLGDTWEWDGANWNQRFPAHSPSARYGAGMAYDTHRRVTVLFGGQTEFDFGVGVLGDTWEWDGVDWRQLGIAGPSARTFVKLAYHASRRRMVLFGGYDGSQMVSDTWALANPGDLDGDGDADLDDYALFAGCMNGPNVSVPPPGCDAANFMNADIDADSDVDLEDFAVLEAAFTG